MFMASVIIFLVTNLLMVSSFIISKKVILDREKITPFECGFDPFSSPRLPFSLRFYLIAVIFLIFDVEIALLIPIPHLLKMFNFNLFMTTALFLLILLLGLYHEWAQGALNWAD